MEYFSQELGSQKGLELLYPTVLQFDLGKIDLVVIVTSSFFF